jgi:hypothetical protein
MAMTYAEQATFVADTAMQDAVRQAALDYCATVETESAATVGADRHALRADFMARVVSEPDYWKVRIAATVARDAALDTTPTDAELLTAVTAAWDRLSAVPGAA